MSREPRTRSIANPGDIIINGVVVIVCVRPPKTDFAYDDDGVPMGMVPIPGRWALPGGELTDSFDRATRIAEAIAYRRIDGPRIAG